MKRLCPALICGMTMLLVGACGDSREGFASPPPPSEPSFATDAGPLEPPDGDTSCVASQRTAEPVTLAMLVLIDRSGSMSGEKWTSATTAIRTFSDRAEVVGTKMGLQFFPPAGSSTDTCNASIYRNLAVPIAPLPDNVIPIQETVASVKADGSVTPMRSGLEGAIHAMRDFLAQEPDHQGVVILVTDGDPTQCGSVSDVAAVAANAAKTSPGLPSIRTFTVGMPGASFGSLNQISKAGGAPNAFNVGTGPGAQQALVDALDEIRNGVISCEYTLPVPPPSEGVLDLESVSLEFTAGKNDAPVTIRKVADASKCGATTGGYYYDDPDTPSRVVLCPASCTQVRGGTLDAKVDLVFGCITKPN